MMTHEQIQQMFREESDDEFFGFELILLILVSLICGFASRGCIGPKYGCVLYASIQSSYLLTNQVVDSGESAIVHGSISPNHDCSTMQQDQNIRK